MAPESYRASDHRTGRKLHGPNSHCAQFPIRIIFRPTSWSRPDAEWSWRDPGDVAGVLSLETGKNFGTNNREQEKPNLE
jgi:hypothetical protein